MEGEIQTMIVSPVQKRRDRVSKACQFCRKKKIKCDGDQPCANCRNSAHAECIYPTESERKPRAKKPKSAKSQSIMDLDNRLAKLESLLNNLAGKMDGGNETPQIEPSTENTMDVAGLVETNYTIPSNDSSAYPMYTTNEEGDYEKSTADSGYSITAPGSSITANLASNMQSLSTNIFHGNHSCFFIFSGKSMEWILNKVPDSQQDCLIPLTNLPTLFSICMKAFNEIWFCPRPTDAELRKLMSQGWFPDDEKLIFELVECLQHVFLVNEIYDHSKLRALFNLYYQEKKANNGNSCNKHRFSELLIMNISLALGISHVIDSRIAKSRHSAVVNRLSKTASYSTKDLLALQTKFFSNSIYYYDMVSVMSDGLLTIQGILLLISYLETSWVKTHVNYILASIAVRYAQEIGLHRSETLVGLPAEEAKMRRHIWWFCEYYDMEVCYRMGKPPLVNPSDVSTLNTKDLTSFTFSHIDPRNLQEIDNLDPVFLKSLLERGGFPTYLCHFITHLNRIRYDSYTALFSANSSVGTLENLVSKIDSLNCRMFKLANSLSASLQPRFYNDSDFSSMFIFRNKVEDLQTLEMAVTFHLTYFTHLMTINRVISRLDIHDQGPENIHIQKFRNLGIESARTILHIVRNVDKNLIPYSCTNWLLFYPFGAFLTLTASCLNRPSKKETLDDVNLLIDVIVSYFSGSSLKAHYEGNDPSIHQFYNQRESVVFMICTIVLTVGIKIIDSKSNFNIYGTNKTIQKMNDICTGICPELYQKMTTSMDLTASSSILSNNYQEDLSTSLPSSYAYNHNGNNDSPFFIPASVLPGPTGYLSTKFESTDSVNESESLQNLLGGSQLENSQNLNMANCPFTTKNQQSGYTFQTGNEFSETLDRLFNGEVNFFFDNNVGV